jgi:hypothetical protein
MEEMKMEIQETKVVKTNLFFGEKTIDGKEFVVMGKVRSSKVNGEFIKGLWVPKEQMKTLVPEMKAFIAKYE